MKKKIESKQAKSDYLDVRGTFLSLTSKTYPHGHEEEVLGFLPDLKKDQFGNYYTIVGEGSKTMFTSHLDTADHRQNTTVRYSELIEGREIITTDGKSILGADDKAGVTVMLYMIKKGVPGLYYFFIGEERGGIGSKRLANDFGEVEHVKNIVRCVSFDRRGTGSVITMQLGRTCCSDTFANALCAQYNGAGMRLAPDPTGIFTDSAMLMGNIPECTNISVGYVKEHTGEESQDITHLEKLCVACCKVDWESLPVDRDLEAAKKSDGDYPSEYKPLIKDARKIDSFGGIEQEQYGWSLYFDIEALKPSDVAKQLQQISDLIDDHRLDSDCYTDNGYIVLPL